MIILFLRRAVKDLIKNRFLNAITVITIALSVLIVSAFILFFININDIIDSWKKGIRIMAYLKSDVSPIEPENIEKKIKLMDGVIKTRFISKHDALIQLQTQMKRQSSLFTTLKENPLPDAFEIRMIREAVNNEKIERLAKQIEALPSVDEVEYGQSWVGHYINIIHLFKLTGYALSGLFFIAAIFIVANTIRLVLYSRQEEVEIMRLVGAEDRFIKAPLYIEGIILGALGGIIGMLALYMTFFYISSNMERHLISGFFNIRFFPTEISCGLVLCSTFVGWLGCFLSLRQFLAKNNRI
ncbi:permease-like cell division protein FtsX [Desulfococcaceae bacterium HSG9]|nr:permease-like cell division protein FtsX [Desulfococcaceae bacterium HSG9]